MNENKNIALIGRNKNLNEIYTLKIRKRFAMQWCFYESKKGNKMTHTKVNRRVIPFLIEYIQVDAL